MLFPEKSYSQQGDLLLLLFLKKERKTGNCFSEISMGHLAAQAPLQMSYVMVRRTKTSANHIRRQQRRVSWSLRPQKISQVSL